MDEKIVCPWRKIKTVKSKENSIDGKKVEIREKFEICEGQACPYYVRMNPSAGYPNKCGRTIKTT